MPGQNHTYTGNHESPNYGVRILTSAHTKYGTVNVWRGIAVKRLIYALLGAHSWGEGRSVFAFTVASVPI